MASLIRRFLVVAAILTLASSACFAASLCGTDETLNLYLGTGYTCYVGDKTFSNFTFDSGTELMTSADVAVSPASSDNGSPATDVGLTFEFGQLAENTVNAGQTLNVYIQYEVTAPTPWEITSVYTDMQGQVFTSSAHAVADKYLCPGGVFGSDDTGCTAQQTAASYSFLNGGDDDYSVIYPTSPANQVFGVSDVFILTGGTASHTNGSAEMDSITNSFGQTEGETGIPEPATLLLIGSALLGLGALWRKRV